jgi:hypothetical protein
MRNESTIDLLAVLTYSQHQRAGIGVDLSSVLAGDRRRRFKLEQILLIEDEDGLTPRTSTAPSTGLLTIALSRASPAMNG